MVSEVGFFHPGKMSESSEPKPRSKRQQRDSGKKLDTDPETTAAMAVQQSDREGQRSAEAETEACEDQQSLAEMVAKMSQSLEKKLDQQAQSMEQRAHNMNQKQAQSLEKRLTQALDEQFSQLG